MKRFFIFILCLIPPYGAALTGVFFRPGEWYLQLNRPWWTPPGWAFPVVWNILYLLMGVTLYKLWHKKGLKSREGFFYGLTIFFNALWSPLFFGAHAMGLALFDMILLFFFLLLFFREVFTKERSLFYLNIPYALWLMVALSLNTSLIYLNP